ncbi:hypothetical protein Rrhod_0888 [Rhodococcus rhodnii LMG 5362]|uniref:Histidine kinase/HSP90-like ATPase domain-containing protein n=1 Tax=Rhodococcus rhodnii LMG 5362 TaxID=1273125 RepID=R7WQZ1_9NOCA|nr:hypothetical protein Rrhod_0888 [Rhodococcus rhodnii LMG 5362]
MQRAESEGAVAITAAATNEQISVTGRHRRRPPYAEVSLSYHGIGADPSQLPTLRRQIGAWLGGIGVDSRQQGDVVLATYEAFANVVEHAYVDSDEDPLMDVEATYVPDTSTLRVTVADHGTWREQAGDSGRDTESNRGNGVRLIRRLAAHTEIERTCQGTVVTMTWHIDVDPRSAVW